MNGVLTLHDAAPSTPPLHFSPARFDSPLVDLAAEGECDEADRRIEAHAGRLRGSE